MPHDEEPSKIDYWLLDGSFVYFQLEDAVYGIISIFTEFML